MNKLKIVNGMVAAFLLLPIWLYLLHGVLTAVGASEVQWLLYWVYVPLHFFASFVAEITKE